MDDSDSRDSRRRLGSFFLPSELMSSRGAVESDRSSSADMTYASAAELFRKYLDRSNVSVPNLAPVLISSGAAKMLARLQSVTTAGTFSLIKNSTSATAENSSNERRLVELRSAFSQKLLAALRDNFIEPGVVSTADKIVQDSIQQNRLATQSWINSLFIQYYSQPTIAGGLLLLIGRLSYEDAAPTGPTMATAGLSHINAEVAEAAVRAFEHWASRDSLAVLENVKTPHQWLNDYIDSVKKDIRTQLCD